METKTIEESRTFRNRLLGLLREKHVAYNVKKEEEQITKLLSQISGTDPKKTNRERRILQEQIRLRWSAWENYCEKTWMPYPCKVHYSGHLQRSLAVFRIEQEMEQITAMFTAGCDVSKGFSKDAANGDKWDYTLCLWRIRHLHMDKLIPQADSLKNLLLFFMTDAEGNIYCLDVQKHPRGAGFMPELFLEILLEEGLLELAGFSQADIIAPEYVMTDAQRYKMLCNGVNPSFYTIGGKYYMNINSVSTAGTPVNITMRVQKLMKHNGYL